VKFGALLGRALREFDCAAVATGHYARVDALEDADAPGGRRYRLLTGRDADKDQSYFLYGLRQDQLARTTFPLGELTKPQVRDVARRHGLVTAEKPESQEICFVPGGDYREALRTRAGWSEERVRCLTSTARSLASTAVQPRTRSASARAWRRARRATLRLVYRCRGQPRHPRPARGSVSQRFRTGIGLVRGRPAARGRIPDRGSHSASGTARARVRPPAGDRWQVSLDQPAWAPAPGQAAVFYATDEVVGGGRIADGV